MPFASIRGSRVFYRIDGPSGATGLVLNHGSTVNQGGSFFIDKGRHSDKRARGELEAIRPPSPTPLQLVRIAKNIRRVRRS